MRPRCFSNTICQMHFLNTCSNKSIWNNENEKNPVKSETIESLVELSVFFGAKTIVNDKWLLVCSLFLPCFFAAKQSWDDVAERRRYFDAVRQLLTEVYGSECITADEELRTMKLDVKGKSAEIFTDDCVSGGREAHSRTRWARQKWSELKHKIRERVKCFLSLAVSGSEWRENNA